MPTHRHRHVGERVDDVGGGRPAPAHGAGEVDARPAGKAGGDGGGDAGVWVVGEGRLEQRQQQLEKLATILLLPGFNAQGRDQVGGVGRGGRGGGQGGKEAAEGGERGGHDGGGRRREHGRPKRGVREQALQAARHVAGGAQVGHADGGGGVEGLWVEVGGSVQCFLTAGRRKSECLCSPRRSSPRSHTCHPPPPPLAPHTLPPPTQTHRFHARVRLGLDRARPQTVALVFALCRAQPAQAQGRHPPTLAPRVMGGRVAGGRGAQGGQQGGGGDLFAVGERRECPTRRRREAGWGGWGGWPLLWGHSVACVCGGGGGGGERRPQTAKREAGVFFVAPTSKTLRATQVCVQNPHRKKMIHTHTPT